MNVMLTTAAALGGASAIPTPTMAADWLIDPVVAAIEAFRAVTPAYFEAWNAIGAFDERLHKAFGGYPAEPHVTMRGGYRVTNSHEIDAAVAKLGAAFGSLYAPEQIERDRAAAQAALDSASAKLAAQREAACPGYGAALAAANAASDAYDDAMATVCETVPTTIAGAAALSAFIRELPGIDGFDHSDLIETASDSLHAGLLRLAGNLVH
jgi:hypothetical protein